jgi:hypothetical protein
MDADLLLERDGRDSGIENVMLHRQTKSDTILRDRKTDQSVGDHSEAVCGDFRSVYTASGNHSHDGRCKEDSCIKTVDQITYQ